MPSRPIDGFDISDMLFERPGAKSQYEALYYYRRRQLQAIRVGDWKYHLPLAETHPNWTSVEPTGPGRPGKLVNLREDLGEQQNVAGMHPEVILQMTELMRRSVTALGNDDATGQDQRAARTLNSSSPLLLTP